MSKTFAWADVVGTLASALDVDPEEVNEGHAGGTTTLWGETTDERVILVGEQDGPWAVRRVNGTGEEVVAVDGFVVQVTLGGAERFLDGPDPDLHVELPADLDALRRALSAITGG